MTMLKAIHPLHLAVATLLFSVVVPPEVKLKETDHKNLSKVVGAYFTAMDEEKEITESMQNVLEQIENTEKRMKGAKLLAAVGDWEQVFRLVTESRLKQTLKKKGEVSETKLATTGGNKLEVALSYCTPKKPPKGALPLVLIACDSGEGTSAHLNTHWNDPTLREGAFLVAIDLGKDVDTWGVFGSVGTPGGAFIVMTALGLIQRELPIDANRVYLVGSGKGFAAVEATASSFPHVFAGVIGLGDVAAVDVGSYENFRTLPTLFLKPGEGVKPIEAKLTELGFANSISIPDGGPTPAWEWMGKTPRVAYPAHVTFAPKSDYAKRVHWISMGGFQSAEAPRIEAKADKASNTITIDAEKIADLIVYLNDELVDLDKPVRFVVNGTTHEQTIERNGPEMIRNQFYFGDWGRVFTASVNQDVPAK